MSHALIKTRDAIIATGLGRIPGNPLWMQGSIE